mmetsp:Transcript_30006/g.53224  ORF Transcript_30006/g.53224 Transcript_30006/m.53224 type:complete len:233 (-) Transcript_30006:35-733(-)
MMRCLGPFLRAAKGKPQATLGKQAFPGQREREKGQANLDRFKQSISQKVISQIQQEQQAQEPYEPMPKHLGKICALGALPGVMGMVGMMSADVNGPVFHTIGTLLGSYLGTNMAFFGGAMVGFEVMGYKPDLYASSNQIYTKGRLWFGLAQISLFLLSLWSSLNESWRGYMLLCLGIGVNCLYSFSAVGFRTVPMWFSKFMWLWAVNSSGLSLFLTYSNLMQEIHKEKLKRS